MKVRIPGCSLLTGFFLFFLTVVSPSEQTQSQASQRDYFLVSYIKVTPGRWNDYLKLEKEVWKPVEQEKLKQGKINSWALYQVLFPSGASEAYDFVSVEQVKGWSAIEKITEGTGDIAKKILTREQQTAFDKSDQVRNIAKMEIWYMDDGFFKDRSGTPTKYHMANYMKVPEGKWEEYMVMEKQLVKPIHEEHMKIGGRDGWGLYVLYQPAGADLPYQAATIDYYGRWDMLGNMDQSSIWAQIHPGKTPDYISRQINSTRSLIRQELRMLVDYVK